MAELLRELSLRKDEELLFLQLPDTLPGQPPTQDIKPIKTEAQGEDGQMVLIKQEKDRVCRLRSRFWGNPRLIAPGRSLDCCCCCCHCSSLWESEEDLFMEALPSDYLLLLSTGGQAGRECLYLG